MDSVQCGKCHGEAFSRVAQSHEGVVVEWFCPYDGWVQPVLISLLGRIVVQPSKAEEWKPEGYHQQQAAAGKLGGLASAAKLKDNPLWKRKGKPVGSHVGPYARREPKGDIEE